MQARFLPTHEIVAPLGDTNDLVIGDVVKIFQIYKAQPDWAAFFMKQLIPALRAIKEYEGDKKYLRQV
jgi:hypothetical protein